MICLLLCGCEDELSRREQRRKELFLKRSLTIDERSEVDEWAEQYPLVKEVRDVLLEEDGVITIEDECLIIEAFNVMQILTYKKERLKNEKQSRKAT